MMAKVKVKNKNEVIKQGLVSSNKRRRNEKGTVNVRRHE